MGIREPKKAIKAFFLKKDWEHVLLKFHLLPRYVNFSLFVKPYRVGFCNNWKIVTTGTIWFTEDRFNVFGAGNTSLSCISQCSVIERGAIRLFDFLRGTGAEKKEDKRYEQTNG